MKELLLLCPPGCVANGYSDKMAAVSAPNGDLVAVMTGPEALRRAQLFVALPELFAAVFEVLDRPCPTVLGPAAERLMRRTGIRLQSRCLEAAEEENGN